MADMDELQKKMAQAIEYFSEIGKIKVKNNRFIQKKVNQISDLEKEFRKFTEGSSIIHNINMRTHADNLMAFAERCEDDNISNDHLLGILKPLLDDSKQCQSKAKSLKNDLERVIRTPLDKIIREIFEYNEKITKKRKDLPEKIDKADKIKENALSYAIGGFIAAGIGAIAIVAAPFTAGASLAVAELGAAVVFGGATTAAVSGAVAGGSFIASGVLNFELESVREEFSQFLKRMQESLSNINEIITDCEFYWEKEIAEIGDIIIKLERNEDKQLIKPIIRGISARAMKILMRS